ncbi:MAG: shikimate kinase [Crocinitomicaceae bacterium]|nr:shikimate kinase [Crocinitomicaceae bacterium]
MRIVLVGYMGSGKTTFGKILAKKLGVPFLDSDKFISSQQGMEINEIFQEKGEAFFRSLEKEFISNLMHSTEDFVLSTGGGLPCFENNMDLLNQIGTTIYLEMSPNALLKRLENGKESRPLIKELSDNELLVFIERQLKERNPYYQQAQIKFHGINAKNSEEISKLIDSITLKKP